MKKPVQIAVLAPSLPRELFDILWKGVWSAAFELAPFGVRVDRFETNHHDLTAQKRILANLLDKPPSALALAPAHIKELDPEIAQLAALRVPTITFHTDAPASKRALYVGSDPAKSGALAAEILGGLMGGRGTVASFPGPLETEHLKQRYLAFRAELKRCCPEIRESISHSGYSGLAEGVGRVMRWDPPANGIYVGCCRSFEVASALESMGMRIPLVGFDLTEASQRYLADGTISALIDENVYLQGYLAVHHAYEAIHPALSESSAPGYLPATVMMRAHANSELGVGGLEGLIRILNGRAHRYLGLLDEASSRLAMLSETDPVTGLLNRSKFEEQLSARVRDQNRLGLLLIGLDGFERARNRISHPVSDEALKSVATVLKTLSRPEDDCARIAGDEFCILMPGANPAQVSSARERILEALSRTVIAPQTLHLNIRVSAGGACLPDDASNAEDLLVRADNAMFAHKRALAAVSTLHVARPGNSGMPAVGRTGDRFQV